MQFLCLHIPHWCSIWAIGKQFSPISSFCHFIIRNRIHMTPIYMPTCKGIYLNDFSSQPDFAEGQLHHRSWCELQFAIFRQRLLSKAFDTFRPFKGHWSISKETFLWFWIWTGFSKTANEENLRKSPIQINGATRSTSLCGEISMCFW